MRPVIKYISFYDFADSGIARGIIALLRLIKWIISLNLL